MSSKITKRQGNKIIIQTVIHLDGSLFEMEEAIEASLNEAGALATGEALAYCDADGSPITIGDDIWTAKKPNAQTYQTPYGPTKVVRHLYQSKHGGKTFCPLEQQGRMVLTATPKLAKILSSKYACMGAGNVARDLLENHGVKQGSTYIKSITDVIGTLAQSKEESWTYSVPELSAEVASVGVSMDGTCMLMCETGWREAMTGCLSLYDKQGDRMHTIYLGATPEYGKATFKERLDREIADAKNNYPHARFVGIADGAAENWKHLNPQTDTQILDFWHASEYIGKAASLLYKKKAEDQQRRDWIETELHKLKHNHWHAARLITQLTDRRESLRRKADKVLMDTILTYLTNNKSRMNYAYCLENNLPIGSGVCEAACKTLIKQRLCNSGMRWKELGASFVISLRALQQTSSRWKQFWSKIIQYGL